MKIRFVIYLFIFLVVGCQKEEVKNNEASLLKMSFNFGDVNFDGNEGTIKAPVDIEVERLIPTIQISEGAVVYPPSKATTDFTEPVDYTVTSEDQKNVNYYTVSVLLPIVKFIVFDCTNRTAESPVAELASGTNISIFKENESGEKLPLEEITTDENGEALFYGYRDIRYYFRASKNGAVNIINGYIVNGIFESQEDIDNYPPQNHPSQIGDLKFVDINGNGEVNEEDRVDYSKTPGIPENGIKEVIIYIAKE